MARRVDDKAPPAIEQVAGAGNGVALYGRWLPSKVEGLAGIKTTLDVTTDRGKALLVAAGSPSDLGLDETGRCSFRVVDFAAFWDWQLDEETGEVKEFVRSVFYTRDGSTFRSTSPHAPHFFARCVDVYGLDKVREGLPVTVTERRSKREKRTYHDFRVEVPHLSTPHADVSDDEI